MPVLVLQTCLYRFLYLLAFKPGHYENTKNRPGEGHFASCRPFIAKPADILHRNCKRWVWYMQPSFLRKKPVGNLSNSHICPVTSWDSDSSHLPTPLSQSLQALLNLHKLLCYMDTFWSSWEQGVALTRGCKAHQAYLWLLTQARKDFASQGQYGKKPAPSTILPHPSILSSSPFVGWMVTKWQSAAQWVGSPGLATASLKHHPCHSW